MPLKFWLHHSKDEQKKRFEKRLRLPEKRWKFSKDDLKTRVHWDEYNVAYDIALERTDRPGVSPWFVIPADHKEYAQLCVARIVRQAMQAMPLAFPPAESGLDKLVIQD